MHRGKRLLHVRYNFTCTRSVKLTTSRPVREKQKPRICHGKLTTTTNGGPVDGRKVSKLTYVHVETCTLVHVDAVLQLESCSDRFIVYVLY